MILLFYHSHIWLVKCRVHNKKWLKAVFGKRMGSCRCGRKPSSVVGRSSILAACCHTVVAISLEARRAAVSLLFGSCIGWGLQRASVTSARVSSCLAFPSLLHACAWGGFFLLHFPWSCLHRPLAGTLPCDARTFLTAKAARSPGRPTAVIA